MKQTNFTQYGEKYHEKVEQFKIYLNLSTNRSSDKKNEYYNDSGGD